MGDLQRPPPGLFVLQGDGSLVGLSETPYDSEALLQELLAKYPDLLAGDQIDSGTPRRWLLITRELGVPDDVDAANRWSLDHLFVDQDGIPTLVEVKRGADTRVRREVVGQMLDYAANAVVHWPIDAIRVAFEQRCERDGKEPGEELRGFLDLDMPPESLWAAVKTNLQAGKIRLLFVSDVIPPELRRIVEFLNKQMDPAQVLAVEIRQYAGQGLTTLLPRVFGQTSQTEQKKAAASPRGRRWDEESFFAKLAERGIEHDVRLARKLFDWATEHTTRVDFGSGVKSASFIPVLEFGDGSWFGPFRVFSGYTGAYIEVPLGGAGMRAAPFDDPDMKRELVRRLNAIRGVQIAEELGRFPSIYPQSLADESAAVQFLAVMEWAVGAVKAASVSPGES